MTNQHTALATRFVEAAADALRDQGVAVDADQIERAAAHAGAIRDAYISGDRASALAALAALALRAETDTAAPLTSEAVREDSDPVLETTGLDEYVPEGARCIKFLAREVNTFEALIETTWLDEEVPTWRDILADPDNRDAPGRYELETAIWERMRDDDRLGGSARFKLTGMDRDPVRFRIRRTDPDGTTTVHDIALPADLLDANGFQYWRAAVDQEDPKLTGWALDCVAQLAADQLGGRVHASRLHILTVTR